MSTIDCPGANPVNNDKLSRGCWAEHKDSSLIFVKDIDENDRVIFEMYDLTDPKDPVYYPHAMSKTDFEKQFSYKSKVQDVKWTWHDKTPFVWDKVMRIISNPVPARPAEAQISAAKKVAESLKAKACALDEVHLTNAKGDDNINSKSIKELWTNFKTVVDGYLR